MSVQKGRRTVSQYEFLDKAKNVFNYGVNKCKHFPKTYTFLITQRLVDLHWNLLTNVKMAERIRVDTCYSDYVYRRRLIQQAIGDCDAIELSVMQAFELLKGCSRKPTNNYKKKQNNTAESEKESIENTTTQDKENQKSEKKQKYRPALSLQEAAYWGKLCQEERTILQGLLNSDRKAFKKKFGSTDTFDLNDVVKATYGDLLLADDDMNELFNSSKRINS